MSDHPQHFPSRPIRHSISNQQQRIIRQLKDIPIRFSLPCTLAVLLLLLNCSCSGNRARHQTGPVLPDSETALIWAGDPSIIIESCNGRTQGNLNRSFTVLPGDTSVIVSIEDQMAETVSAGSILLRFTAEAGHRYSIQHNLSLPGRFAVFIVDHNTGKPVQLKIPLSVQLANAENGIKQFPDNAQFWGLKAYALTGLGKYTEALTAIDKAIQLQPDFVEAWFLRSTVLCSLKKYEEALASIDKAIQLQPTDPELQKAKENVLKEIKENDEKSE